MLGKQQKFLREAKDFFLQMKEKFFKGLLWHNPVGTLFDIIFSFTEAERNQFQHARQRHS